MKDSTAQVDQDAVPLNHEEDRQDLTENASVFPEISSSDQSIQPPSFAVEDMAKHQLEELKKAPGKPGELWDRMGRPVSSIGGFNRGLAALKQRGLAFSDNSGVWHAASSVVGLAEFDYPQDDAKIQVSVGYENNNPPCVRIEVNVVLGPSWPKGKTLPRWSTKLFSSPSVEEIQRCAFRGASVQSGLLDQALRLKNPQAKSTSEPRHFEVAKLKIPNAPSQSPSTSAPSASLVSVAPYQPTSVEPKSASKGTSSHRARKTPSRERTGNVTQAPARALQAPASAARAPAPTPAPAPASAPKTSAPAWDPWAEDHVQDEGEACPVPSSKPSLAAPVASQPQRNALPKEAIPSLEFFEHYIMTLSSAKLEELAEIRRFAEQAENRKAALTREIRAIEEKESQVLQAIRATARGGTHSFLDEAKAHQEAEPKQDAG